MNRPKRGDNYYELTNTTITKEVDGEKIQLTQIRLLEDIVIQHDFKTYKFESGTLGGFIENKNSLRNNSWVCVSSFVYGNSKVDKSSLICDDVTISNCLIENSHIDSTNINDSGIKNSTVYKCDISESEIYESNVKESDIHDSCLSRVDCYRSQIKETTFSGKVSKSIIDDSTLSGSNHIISSNIRRIDLSKSVKFVMASINTMQDIMIFEKVGMYQLQLISYRDINNLLKIYHDGFTGDVHEFETKVLNEYMGSSHSKNIFNIIDIICRSANKEIMMNRVNAFKRRYILAKGFIRTFTHI